MRNIYINFGANVCYQHGFGTGCSWSSEYSVDPNALCVALWWQKCISQWFLCTVRLVFSVSNFASDNVLLDCCYIVEFSDLLDSGSKWDVISQQVV